MTRTDIDVFARRGDRLMKGLAVLAAGESATDDVARELLSLLDVSPEWVERFLEAVHACDFVVERNSEWHFAPEARRDLVQALMTDEPLARSAHTLLYRLATDHDGRNSDMEVPRYLTVGPGAAYHGTFLAPADEVWRYGELGSRPLSGQQWLASTLAAEQVELGVIPATSLEVQFLRGMVLYRENRTAEAEPLLRAVAQSGQRRREVATASHLVGRLDGRRYATRKRGESLLRYSLDLCQELGDRQHQAQVLHSLGRLVGRDRKRGREAEALLRGSLERQDDATDKARVLHTLGQLVGRTPSRAAVAETMLRDSLKQLDRAGDRLGVAEVSHTLGQLLGRRGRKHEAEELLRHSADLGSQLGALRHEAQVLNTLGRLISTDASRADEARSMLNRSLELGEALDLRAHQARVLYSLAQVPGTSVDESKALLRRSLAIDRSLGDKQGERIRIKALRQLKR